MLKSKFADFALRVAVGLAIGVLFGWLLSDGAYMLLGNKRSVQREPERVEIVIPYGTAEQVEKGLYNPTIPNDMVLAQGDILVVKNEDVIDHQLGPLWIPAKTSGVLALDTASKYVYACSFQPTNYLGLDVRPRVDRSMQLSAIAAIALPTGFMLAVYSYLLPGRKRTPANG